MQSIIGSFTEAQYCRLTHRNVYLSATSLQLDKVLADPQEVFLQCGVVWEGLVVKLGVLEVLEQQEGVDAGGAGCGGGRGGRGHLVDVGGDDVADCAPVLPLVEGHDSVVEHLVGPGQAGPAALVGSVLSGLGQGVAVHQDTLDGR